MRGRHANAARPVPCFFEDSDSNCHTPQSHGVCSVSNGGAAAALVQHADFTALCKHNPPFGFRPLCTGEEASTAVKMLRTLRDPARCFYPSCAVVGASGNLLGARLGGAIDAHAAVIRVNLAPDGRAAAAMPKAPHTHTPTWVADVGERTTWRVLTMELYGYLKHYPRLWLAPPLGHGRRANMSGIPQEPLLAVSCHQPGRSQGRCRSDRLRQVFAHEESASYLINPLLVGEMSDRYFADVENQKVLSTGMTAIAFATRMCGEVHLYGFGNGSCGDQCYHYYDCSTRRGAAPTSQAHFFSNSKASGGFHNFSAQAQVLLRLTAEGKIWPYWGQCSRSFGNAPAEYVRNGSAKHEALSLARHAHRRGRLPVGARRGSAARRERWSAREAHAR
uniref:Uncharacterized protein n=1 Tax=Calcidiscus leptoporus TaxID=127549 RepID=A0A7S0JCX0_9EUKA|mmetsp:Transcript_50930/g.117222  ORF Transcript_50930/g.117222 Transcript_50930/m.117222 type:complete len:391 (+) Transcript_50930:59-1231(+)